MPPYHFTGFQVSVFLLESATKDHFEFSSLGWFNNVVHTVQISLLSEHVPDSVSSEDLFGMLLYLLCLSSLLVEMKSNT